MSYQDEKAIKESIMSAFANSSAKAHIGKPVIASRFICPVAPSVPNLGIISLRVSKTNSNYLDTIEIGVDEFPETTEYQITIV